MGEEKQPLTTKRDFEEDFLFPGALSEENEYLKNCMFNCEVWIYVKKLCQDLVSILDPAEANAKLLYGNIF